MSQINLENFKKLEKERNNVHRKVMATYSVFYDYTEEKTMPKKSLKTT